MSVTPWLADAWTQLAARRAAARFPHAVLVAGPAGLGKREFVAALAASLLCTTPGVDGRPSDAGWVTTDQNSGSTAAAMPHPLGWADAASMDFRAFLCCGVRSRWA